jgi:hypothetical protein
MDEDLSMGTPARVGYPKLGIQAVTRCASRAWTVSGLISTIHPAFWPFRPEDRAFEV